MNQEDYYYQLKTKCAVSDKLLEYADQDNNFSIATFLQKVVPFEIIKQDSVLLYFNNAGWVVKILKMHPFTFYDWHRDSGRRGCAVNLLITDVRCTTLFREDNYCMPRQKKILELAYLPDTYYMFNTAADHSVTNFEFTRYSLSLFPPYNPDFIKERKEYFKYLEEVKNINL